MVTAGRVDSIDHYGSRRPQVKRVGSAWDQGSGGVAEFVGAADAPLTRASTGPKRRARTPLTEDEVDTMRTARANGVSVTALAMQFSVHRGTVWEKTRSG